MPDYLNPSSSSDRTTLEALGMVINPSDRTIDLPTATIELDLPLMVQDWTVRGSRRNVRLDGSVLKPSASFSDPAGRGSLVFCPSGRIDISDVVIDADSAVPVALELNTAHASHLSRVVGARGTRACIAIRNTRAMMATHCKATGWNEAGRVNTGTGWLIEQSSVNGTEQKPSQNLFLNCTATWCGGDGVQIVGDYNKWLGGIVEQCAPVDATGARLPMRVTVAADGLTVAYETETSPGTWSAYTADTGPGLGFDIQGGDAVHVEAVWFEGVAVDCVAITGRFHSLEKCMIAAGGAEGARSVRLVEGWRSSVVRCTVATGAKNRVAIHQGDPNGKAMAAHILRHGGAPVIAPFVGNPANMGNDEQKGCHHVIEFCSLHTTIGHTGPGVEVNNVLVPQ